jgi:hypothetical protein
MILDVSILRNEERTILLHYLEQHCANPMVSELRAALTRRKKSISLNGDRTTSIILDALLALGLAMIECSSHFRVTAFCTEAIQAICDEAQRLNKPLGETPRILH